MKFCEVDRTWTLFLDRDGVINKRKFGGYITSTEEFTFQKGALEALSFFNKRFGHIIIVTNQQCVGKGIITVETLDEIHTHMIYQIEMAGGRVDRVYSAKEPKGEAPFHRKPYPAMAYLAKEELASIDFKKSIMVGDTDSDIEFGKNLGMKTVLVLSQEATKLTPDLRIEFLSDLCAYF
ncbi:MAG: HAD-IIIA family hydrolase [Bacteroidetes bacterium]|nr:HAD-IIIA family hydrolase [Bacteroidota bacterium]